MEDLTRQAAGVPGVLGTTTSSAEPFGRTFWNSLQIRNEPWQGDTPVADYEAVGHGYFALQELRPVEGRTFLPLDATPGTPEVVVVNEAMARTHFSDRSPVGAELGFAPEGPWWRVVGVVPDVSEGPGMQVSPRVYLPNLDVGLPWRNGTRYLLVQTAGATAPVIPGLRQVLRELDPEVPFSDVHTFQEIRGRFLAQPRFLAVLTGAFAILALLLGSVGIYGVVSTTVRERRREVGIRLAIGAEPSSVVARLVYGEILPLAIGLAVGVLGAVWVGRLTQVLLYGVQPTDLPTYGVITSILLGVGVLSAWLPARAAALVDPREVLRE